MYLGLPGEAAMEIIFDIWNNSLNGRVFLFQCLHVHNVIETADIYSCPECNLNPLLRMRFSVILPSCKSYAGVGPTTEKRHGPHPSIMEALSQNNSLISRKGHRPNRSHPFCVQLPNIQPSKVLFVG